MPRPIRVSSPTLSGIANDQRSLNDRRPSVNVRIQTLHPGPTFAFRGDVGKATGAPNEKLKGVEKRRAHPTRFRKTDRKVKERQGATQLQLEISS
jgi:hypothetical protein